MTAEETLRGRVGGSWEERAGAWWRRVALDELCAAARILRDGGARLAAIVALPGADGVRLSWHFAIGGALLALEAAPPPGAAVPSLVDIYPGADWAERETRDYFAVSFTGRAHTPPLVLRGGDPPGILLPPRGRPCPT